MHARTHARRRKDAEQNPESLMVRYWKEKMFGDAQTGASIGEISYGDWYKQVTRPPTPPAKQLPTLTPNERVQLRNVLPPKAEVKNKAEKTKVKLKLNKKTGKYIQVVSIEKPKNNYFADELTSNGKAKN
eukprot:SAG22_NODE_4859_length_1149_cov_1.627619_2_plen_130_part_00